MAIMDYVTPGLTKIDFEDSLFVTTELDGDENKEVKGYIEYRGGIIKNSVTESTNYLIYQDGKEETTNYKKAMELIRDKGLEIIVLPFSLFLEIGIGEGLMEFGSYPFEADGTEKPIRWIILQREGKRALLLSACSLDVRPYNKEETGVTWETCTLRNWLNWEFYVTAFTEDEKRRILLTKVSNEDNPWYHTPGGNDTEDWVFLLSIREVKEYLPSNLYRRRASTPFTRKQGVNEGNDGNCLWWLRTPGYGPYDAAYVNNVGDIEICGCGVDYSGNAVCPALWIDLESGIE